MKWQNGLVVLMMVAGSIWLVNEAAGLEGGAMEKKSEFAKIYAETPVTDGVRKITYEQLMRLKKSGEPFTLIDVLAPESYAKGHIEGAISLPVDAITKAGARAQFPKGARLVTYCASFQCAASTAGARKFSDLGYEVLDYKGGLQEWEEKGNKLVK
jgi:rhodanese-related sulfurtransferase